MKFWQRRVKRKTTPDNKKLRFLCGFRADHVRVTTSVQSTPNEFDWYAGDADDTARQTAGATGNVTKITTGITVGHNYFETGTYSGFNTADDTLIVQAWGQGGDDGIRDTSDTNQLNPVAYDALDLDTDEGRVGTIPTSTAASFTFTEGEQDDISWLQREA